MSTREWTGKVLEFVTCFWIILILNKSPIVHFCGCGGCKGGVTVDIIYVLPLIWYILTDLIFLNFLKAVFYKFYLVHS